MAVSGFAMPPLAETVPEPVYETLELYVVLQHSDAVLMIYSLCNKLITRIEYFIYLFWAKDPPDTFGMEQGKR